MNKVPGTRSSPLRTVNNNPRNIFVIRRSQILELFLERLALVAAEASVELIIVHVRFGSAVLDMLEHAVGIILHAVIERKVIFGVWVVGNCALFPTISFTFLLAMLARNGSTAVMRVSVWYNSQVHDIKDAIGLECTFQGPRYKLLTAGSEGLGADKNRDLLVGGGGGSGRDCHQSKHSKLHS